ncbi:MAG: hypothetical protein JO345_24480 [Streptosporangiaceae bacterium]|nr:hypothetical protein [Streptosporangiaceae bacterium]
MDAGAISLYPGAAGPVSGWWLPMVIVVAVMPGALALSGPEPEDAEPEPDEPPAFEPPLDEQAPAVTRAAAAKAVMARVRL